MSATRPHIVRNAFIAYVTCALFAAVLSFVSVADLMTDAEAPVIMIKLSAYLFSLYLCGSIPFGLIFTRMLMNQDVREIGSGNIGMTNVMRTGSKLAGVLTLAFDLMKGIIPLLLFRPPVDSLYLSSLYYLTFLLPVIGHMFPCWLNFKGGKGIATGFGVILLFCWPLALGMMGIWALIARFTKLSSLAGLVAFGLLPFVAWYLTTLSAAVWTFCLAGLVFWAHRDNIRRLLSGQESKFGAPTL